MTPNEFIIDKSTSWIYESYIRGNLIKDFHWYINQKTGDYWEISLCALTKSTLHADSKTDSTILTWNKLFTPIKIKKQDK